MPLGNGALGGIDAEGGGDAFERVRQPFGRLCIAGGECRAQGGRCLGLVFGILLQHGAVEAQIAAHPVQAVGGIDPGNLRQLGGRCLGRRRFARSAGAGNDTPENAVWL